MPSCKGRYVCDTVNKGKVPFYNDDGSISKTYYHLPILCKKESLTNSDLCGICTEKDKKLSTCKISKSNNLSGATHPSILHGKIGEPIPLWSHIEGGEWFKKILSKGYKKEGTMVKKVLDENKIFEYISKLKGLKNKMIDDLIKQFPELTKHSASSYITKYNKKPKNEVENVVELMKTQLIIDTEKKEEVYDIVELIVKPITINNVKYYYEQNKNKVYTLDYDYVGRYNVKEEKLYTEYPDSDKEPNF